MIRDIGMQTVNEWKKAIEANGNEAVVQMQYDCLALSFRISTTTLLRHSYF
jgi:hypothetical protein